MFGLLLNLKIFIFCSNVLHFLMYFTVLTAYVEEINYVMLWKKITFGIFLTQYISVLIAASL